MLSRQPFTESIGYLLKQTQHQARTKMDQRLRPLGLSAGLFAVLAALEGAEGMSGAEIARRCFVKPPTVTVLIASLEQAQLIDRSPSRHHGRIIETRLTQKGIERLSEAYKICEAIEDEMLAGLSMPERAELAQMLASCALHLNTRPTYASDLSADENTLVT